MHFRWMHETVKKSGFVIYQLKKRQFSQSGVFQYEIIDGEIIYHAGCQPLGSIISLSADSGSTLWKAGKDDKAGYAPPLLIESREKEAISLLGTKQNNGNL